MRTTVAGRGPAVVAATAAALLAALPLAGCTADPTGSYCDALTAARAQWKDAGSALGNPAAAQRLVASVRTIEASAPGEVRADWTSLRSLFEKFAVPRPDLTVLTKQMRSFESSAKRVETHARETCGVDLAQ